MMNTCRTCLHLNCVPTAESGECRRFPPRQRAFSSVAVFPIVPMSWWCGEYKVDIRPAI
jgi:hypothetical protein